jgi:hypothetical protein
MPFCLKGAATKAVAFAVILWPIAACTCLVGVLLKWFARGIVLRKRARTALSVFILASWGVFLGISPFLSGRQSGTRIFQSLVQAIALICAAGITALGLTEGERTIDEQQ